MAGVDDDDADADEDAASSFFFESREPIWSCALYFFRIPSLWYFQNCFEASFPATRCRTVRYN